MNSCRLRTCQESSLYRISDLPKDVTECILTKLPIRDAVRTGILSRKWRYRWISLPYLIFYNNCIRGAFNSCQQSKLMDELVKVIHNILIQHDGPILAFTLLNRTMKSCPDIDQWIMHLSRKGIRNFTLELKSGERYKPHSRLFSCSDLRSLTLLCCVIQPPPSFNGFNSLSRLSLYQITISNDVFENFISKCQLLKVLKLHALNGLHFLNIHAPQLQVLMVVDSSKYICLKNTTLLATVVVVLSRLPQMNQKSEHGKPTNFIHNLRCLSSVRVLTAGEYYLKFLAEGNAQSQLPFTFKNLCYIRLVNFPFEDLDSVSCALCLIKSSPELVRLDIVARTNPSADM